MNYIKNHVYNVTYLNKNGEEVQTSFEVNKDTNIAGVISTFKQITPDFFKVLSVDECEKVGGDNQKELTLDSNVREWYIKEYPADELGPEIDEGATFKMINDNPEDIYNIIEVNDSIVRERIFTLISDIANNGYEKLKESEDLTQTKENIKDVISNIAEVTSTTEFAVEATNSNIKVLIADEQSAIEGYKSFLNFAKSAIKISPLYEVLETEINEIIKDEEDHIKKLEVIDKALNL